MIKTTPKVEVKVQVEASDEKKTLPNKVERKSSTTSQPQDLLDKELINEFSSFHISLMESEASSNSALVK